MKETTIEKESLLSRCGDTTPRDRGNLRVFLGVTITWAIVYLATSLAVKQERLPDGLIAWLVASVPAILSIVVCLAYARYLAEADELQRLIHLRALALGFAAGWVALSAYPLFERLGAPAADSGTYVVVMAAFYSGAILLGSRRYR